MHRTFEKTGHAAGMFFFLLGAGLLIACFWFAYTMFSHMPPGLKEALDRAGIQGTPDHPAPPAWPGIVDILLVFTLKLIALGFMIVVASQIASRGIHQYFAAAGPVSHATAPAVSGASPAPALPSANSADSTTSPGESPSSRLPKNSSPQ